LRALRRKAEKILRLLEQRDSELSLRLVDNGEIQELNATYRKKNQPTDVLSFSSESFLPTGERLLGDVVISVEQAKRQAAERKLELGDELERLLIHGILHLLGYDHERSAEDARVMFALERKIRRALYDDNQPRI